MRRHALRLVLCVSLGLGGCATFRAPQAPRDQPLDTSKACAEWRWIGISRSDARCPEVSGWRVEPLFAQIFSSSPAQLAKEGGKENCSSLAEALKQTQARNGLIRELNRFCVYEIADRKMGLKDLPFPPAVSADLVRFDQDCAALSTSARTDPAPGDWRDQYQQFLRQVGRPTEPFEINDWLGVRLAFLDTQPTGEGAPREPGNSPHGFTLAHIARQLVCTAEPQEHCAAQITTQLAMPILEFHPKRRDGGERDLVRGGFLGMQSDLAEAIRSEVDDWQKKKAQEHLVLNLSLAWDGALFGGLGEEQIADLRAGTQAVYRALEYAVSLDVLVIAAAGNQKPLPCLNTGPLLPAGWEIGLLGESCGVARTTPLLYAVGGVGSDGNPIASARPGGMPPRFAFARNAVVPTWDPETPTAMLTGSSVAAAVVSSIAAIVWDTRPDLTSHQVMEILQQSGGELGFPASFRFGSTFPDGPSLPKSRRISLCGALQEACASGRLAACPIAAPCAPLALTPSDDAAEPAFLGTCQSWLFPQPEDPPCLHCFRDPPPPG